MIGFFVKPFLNKNWWALLWAITIILFVSLCIVTGLYAIGNHGIHPSEGRTFMWLWVGFALFIIVGVIVPSVFTLLWKFYDNERL